MSTPEQLAGAAAAIATALSLLPPEDREKAIDIARLICPAEAQRPTRAKRSDAGKSRTKPSELAHASNCATKDGLLCDCGER